MTRNKDILSRFMAEVWNEGREDAVDNYLAPKYTIHHDPGDPWHGKTLDIEGFKNRLRISRPVFPDQCFTIKELIEENDKVPFGEVDKSLMHLRIDLWSVFYKPLKDETFKAIINCLSDKKVVEQYHLHAPVSHIIVIVIKSPHYSQTQKEFVVKSLDSYSDERSSKRALKVISEKYLDKDQSDFH